MGIVKPLTHNKILKNICYFGNAIPPGARLYNIQTARIRYIFRIFFDSIFYAIE